MNAQEVLHRLFGEDVQGFLVADSGNISSEDNGDIYAHFVRMRLANAWNTHVPPIMSRTVFSLSEEELPEFAATLREGFLKELDDPSLSSSSILREISEHRDVFLRKLCEIVSS